MKMRSATRVAIALLSAMGATAYAQENPFDAVFALMTQDRGPDSPGCRGCHIGPGPAIGTYFGNTQDEVEMTFTVDRPDLIEGGRGSTLASFLRDGLMPLSGSLWTDCELELLYAWLDQVAPTLPVAVAAEAAR
jgi:hypothetical protein